MSNTLGGGWCGDRSCEKRYGGAEEGSYFNQRRHIVGGGSLITTRRKKGEFNLHDRLRKWSRDGKKSGRRCTDVHLKKGTLTLNLPNEGV